MCFGHKPSPSSSSAPTSPPIRKTLGSTYTSAEYNAYHSQQYQSQPSTFFGKLLETSDERVARNVASNVWERFAKDTQISAGIGTGSPDPDVERREGRIPKEDLKENQEKIRRVDTPPAGMVVGQAIGDKTLDGFDFGLKK